MHCLYPGNDAEEMTFPKAGQIFNHLTNSYTCLERKSYVKYLGVLIDENLSWKHHILHIASKISTSIGIIARLRHFVLLNT